MRKAQALVEIIIAIGVAVIALLSISRISSRSVYNTGSASRQSAATGYAQSAINYAKNVKEVSGFSAVTNAKFNNGYHCYDGLEIKDVVDATGYCSIGSTDFSGRVTMSRAQIPLLTGKIELTVFAEIQWIEGNLTRMVKNEAKIVLDQ